VIGTTCMLLCGSSCVCFRAADRGCEVGTRPSLRPLDWRGWNDQAKLGRNRSRECGGVSAACSRERRSRHHGAGGGQLSCWRAWDGVDPHWNEFFL